MKKWQWRVFSMLTVLAMALALCPAAVSAAPGDGTITGIIDMAQPENDPGANFYVDAYPVGGDEGAGYCGSNGPVSYNIAGYYEYELTGCDSDLDYTIVAQGSGYTFNPVLVYKAGTLPAVPEVFDSGSATAADITPVDRLFTGKLTKSDGVTPWQGFVVNYELNGVADTTTTDSNGEFTIAATDASTIHIPPMAYEGYRFEHGDLWFNPPQRTDIVYELRSTGTRNAYGRIESINGLKGCTVGVTITAAVPAGIGALTRTTVTDVDGGFGLDNLEPLNTYEVTPTKPGCVFTPPTQTIDVRNGNGQLPIVFTIPDSGIWGKVKTTLGSDVSLAYYLIATYTTNTTPAGVPTASSVSYSNAVNWTDGSYWISAPPSTGTLTISRVGGPAAFGYETASATRNITVDGSWQQQSFTLVPARTIGGTILGQNGVPVQKNATVDFGYGLKWMPAGPTAAYSIKAQPKLYYLSPVENGIISSTPVRFLANLTTAASVTAANFTLNLKTYKLEGCVRDANGNDALVLPAVRFRPAIGYGATLYPATLTANNGCGLGSYYYTMNLPKGLAGNVEADNHTLQGTSIDGMNQDKWNDYNAFGSRAITGRIYSPNPNLNINTDLRSPDSLFTLRDAATNRVVNTDSDMQRSFEFTIPMLEAKSYTLTINRFNAPWGYEAQPYPMIPMVTTNLTAGDVDIPAASGFALVHSPIDPASATGGGYFVGNSSGVTLNWNYPPQNPSDRINDFELQVNPANTAFTDTVPAPQKSWQPGETINGTTDGVLFRWRARTVYEDGSKGPWLDTAPVPDSPTLRNFNSAVVGASAGPVTFEWNSFVTLDPSKVRYQVQYSDNTAFSAVAPAVAVTLTSTPGASSVNTLVNPAIGKTYYWRVKTQYNTTGTTWVDISGWSPTEVFFNRYKNVTGPTFVSVDPNTIQFFAANANTSLPANAHYQVLLQDSGNSSGPYFDWTFPRTANITTPSVYQFLDSHNLPSGTYNWWIGIVYGNDYWAPPISGLTAGAETVTVP